MNKNFISQTATTETKEKFDDFLRAALKKTTDVDDEERDIETSNPNRNENYEVENLATASEEENREFILNKYFENKPDNDVEVVVSRKPVPKPRTKIVRSNHSDKLTTSPPLSNDTFNVTSPKISPRNEIEVISVLPRKAQTDSISLKSSTNTFKVTIPKILKSTEIDHNTVNESNGIQASKENIHVLEKDTPHRPINASRLIDVRVKNAQCVHESHLNDDSSRKSSAPSRTSKTDDNIVTDTKTEQTYNLCEAIENETENQIDKYSFEKAIHLVIHRTDKLQLNSFLIHPVVKIHIVDINTGKYFPKKCKERPVIYYYDSNLDYLAPVMTRPYNLREQRSLIPMWEEAILINEDFEYLVSEKHNIMMFFEILDFIPIQTKIKNNGWYPIAFAFLKICGINGTLNLEKKLRLQLYCYNAERNDTGKCSVWEIWNNKRMKKYPSSLYISIKSIPLKERISTGLRSKNALQKEVGKEEDLKYNEEETMNNKRSNKNPAISALISTLEKNQKWSRNTKGIGKLPDQCIAQFSTDEGCFTAKFSHDGLFLACAMKVNQVYSIMIYSMVTFEEICHLPGHKEIIYSMCWSPDDTLIVSASADKSVSVWDMVKMTFLQILPHPSFVYAADIGVDIIATGCYDSIVRIWKNTSVMAKYVLFQELQGHDGYVTCVIFTRNNEILYSSDSVGVIIEWCYEHNSWDSKRKIKILDLTNIVINQIILMGREKRLLVHSRDSILRILDLKTLIVVHWLHGGLSRRYSTSCSVSPCNTYIAAGSENSSVNIWKAKNGKYVGNLTPYKIEAITIHTVEFHPKNNMLCIGHFGSELPVLLFGNNALNETEEMKNNLTLIERDASTNYKMKTEKLLGIKNDQSNTLNNVNLKNVLNRLDNLMDVKMLK